VREGSRTRLAIGLAAVLVAADVSVHLVDVRTLHGRVPALDSDTDVSVFFAVETAVLAFAVGLCLVRAARRIHTARYLALAAGFAFVLVGSRLHLRDKLSAWPVVYLPVLAAIVVLLWTTLPREGPARRLAVAAFAVLAASLAIHELAPPLLERIGWGPGSWGYDIKVAFKQALELGGWTLAACSLAVARPSRSQEAAASTRSASSRSRAGLRRSGASAGAR
jgi:hypothetical protein